MKGNSTPLLTASKQYSLFSKKVVLLAFFAILLVYTKLDAQVGCLNPPVPTLTATPSCDGSPFLLQLSNVTPAERAAEAPFDLIINGQTYNDIPLGGSFVPAAPGTDETLFGATVPGTVTEGDGEGGLELGVKFSSSKSGFVTAIRFYSPTTPAGTYEGHIWSSTGTLLASATFTAVGASAWQEVALSTPLAINANTTYIASYFSSTGDYIREANFFTAPFTSGSLSSPQDYAGGATTNGSGNGQYATGAGPAVFPTSSGGDGPNYWVDVRFVPFPATQTGFGATPPSPIQASEGQPVELGVKFSASEDGFVKGIRFFSHTTIEGTYTGHLWTSTGTLLGTATFTNVTGNAWQEVLFTTPIPVTAGTTYIASYNASAGRYVATVNYFTAPVTSGSLTFPQGAGPGPASGGVGNGLYTYGSGVPDLSSNDANYWVDVNFVPKNYTFNLTSITDASGCNNTGALQTVTVTSCSTLPVTLVNISATPKDNSIIVNWTTSAEINNLGFEVQRSGDGDNWSAIGFVNGAGNSTITKHYSYIDEKLGAGRYYYRLKQIDIDQRFEYSAIVSAVVDGKEAFGLEQNFPNPFKGGTVLRFTLPRASKVNLSIFDMNGKLIKVLVNGSKESGTHAISFYPGSLNSGIYYYKLQTEDFSSVKKMIIQ